jgi:hypothetical protein
VSTPWVRLRHRARGLWNSLFAADPVDDGGAGQQR